MRPIIQVWAILCLTSAAVTEGKDVVLVKDGKALAAIYAPAEVMDRKPRHSPVWTEKLKEQDRVRLRKSVEDLALYMEKMSGAKVEVIEGEPPPTVLRKNEPRPMPEAIEDGDDPDDARIPIRIGVIAQAKFGKPARTCEGGQGWRVVVNPWGVGLIGESHLGTSYAIHEVLHRWGCRWYLPSDMGEHYPKQRTLALPEMDVSGAPSTIYRACGGDRDWHRRNRGGGPFLRAHHALETLITKAQREQHPDWFAVINGEPRPGFLKWSKPEVADAIAANIIKQLDERYLPSRSLSPADAIARDQSEDPKHYAGDFDPTTGNQSTTDVLLMLCNRVAEKVTKKYPDVLFGMLAYQDYTRPPVREKLHPDIIPQIAPITFNRAHPMTYEGHPLGKQLLEVVQGWAKVTPRMAHYWYGFNLAEVTAPNPMITKWSIDLPILMQNNCQFWMPEAMTCFEATFPAYYLSHRIAWDSSTDPKQVINELMQDCYGAAAKPMTEYWNLFDKAWVETPVFVGSHWAYQHIFPPELMKKARELMDEALASAQTVSEYRRVKMAADSLTLFELFMKMKMAFVTGRHWASLRAWVEQWRSLHTALGLLYRKQLCYTPNGRRYFDLFCAATYLDCARLVYDARIVRRFTKWKYRADKEEKGEQLGWHKPELDDAEWKTTDTVNETWSSTGYHGYFGHMWYRLQEKEPLNRHLSQIDPGKKRYVWIAASDTTVKLYVNGKTAPHVDSKGEKHDSFSDYATPASFEVTGLLKADATNTFVFHTIRPGGGWINELGTGGILGPVVVYTEK